eukprot:gnl/TRDRNA2_/TRDRNA2_196033_c0_seq1.p1 gnl/TRDRNA2_/TRDRNA2_196033_c0~~gnl/TRDRNA2_/TRDRNA2_196033_c0_seq1.p1  ORF type:complete len:206 (+),score=35.03 gnl/TRDRNA2_/TRDRNA2_196033_c0_seq1:505-1122(+)
MLKRLQAKYVDKPVKFVLVPCNQFKDQEPESNSAIKAFAEKYVTLGPDSNVIMLAKSNLNGRKCTTEGEGTCSAGSTECCPTNDGIYSYLLDTIGRRAGYENSVISWNFDKILIAPDGEPVANIMSGKELDTEIEELVSGLLECYDDELSEEAATLSELSRSSSLAPLPCIGAVCAMALFCAWSVFKWHQSRHQDLPNNYIYLVA